MNRDVLLPVVVADRFAKIAALVGEKETFVRIQVQPVSPDPGIDGVEQRPRFPKRIGPDVARCPTA